MLNFSRGREAADMFLILRMPDGTTHRLEALEGWRVMEVIRDWGLPIKAECGGACACATCHVWVGKNWLAKLTPPSDEELQMLDGAFNVDERSRLCCQIIMAKDLDGLEVELAPESLADAPAERMAVGG
jgi:ferredoxin, 2Fe-2S